LPLYELAPLTAERAASSSDDVEIHLVVPDERPLAQFGEAASEATARLLEVVLAPVSDEPLWSSGEKVVAEELGAYLADHRD
jgi:hypothetical protein